MRTQFANGTNAADQLRGLMDDARRALGFDEHISPGFSEGRRIAKPAIETRVLDLSELSLPPLPTDDQIIIGPNRGGAQSVKLDAAIIAESRVAAAGAQIHVAAERPKNLPPIVGDAAPIALYQDISALSLIRPAPFAILADGISAADSVLPLSTASVNWNDAVNPPPNMAFTTTMHRLAQKSVDGEHISEKLLHAIVQGLARAADATLLGAIVAALPANFSLAAAAAAKLKFSDLRALVGTAGTGAAVGQDGTLRADGVEAELTDVISGTVIGSFQNSAVFIRPELFVHVERLAVNGDLRLSCHVAMAAAVPAPDLFFMGI